MPSVRAFIAIKLPELTRRAIGDQQARLARYPAAHAARWTPPENIHLTLKFLGDVPSGRLPAIEKSLRATTHAHRVFNLRISGLGCFPNVRRPRIVWVGVGGDTEQLLSLQRDIAVGMAELGWPQESRTWSPHLTVGRARKTATTGDIVSLGELFEGTHVGEIARLDITSVSLIKSDLLPGGPIYTDLACAALPPR